MIISPPRLDFASFAIADVPAHPEPFRLINKVPIRDNGESLVDLRETNPELSFGVYCLPYLRESVAEALKFASRNTPDFLDLRINTGLRTLEQQAEMYWSNYKKAKEGRPDWPESVVRRMTNRFFAPPDAKAPPGHCTGAAVDIALLVRETGQGLDVASPLEGWKAAPTAIPGLSPESAENRRLLCYIMHSTGLSNCRDEFWHWSYGDSAWAVRVGAPTACFGLIEPPTGATRVTGAKIELTASNQEWPRQFEGLRWVLAAKLGRLALGIEHIGSTAVAGLAAKPVLDIDIVVRNADDMALVIQSLGELGYVHEGEIGIAGREAFRCETEEVPKVDPPCKWPAHHLYACIEGSTELRRHLAFRDCLRRRPSLAAEYADLKTALAARYPWDRTRYGEGKGPFIEAVLHGIDVDLATPRSPKNTPPIPP
jgi:D-alanyl-D-alanine dipeptidase